MPARNRAAYMREYRARSRDLAATLNPRPEKVVRARDHALLREVAGAALAEWKAKETAWATERSQLLAEIVHLKQELAKRPLGVVGERGPETLLDTEQLHAARRARQKVIDATLAKVNRKTKP